MDEITIAAIKAERDRVAMEVIRVERETNGAREAYETLIRRLDWARNTLNKLEYDLAELSGKPFARRPMSISGASTTRSTP